MARRREGGDGREKLRGGRAGVPSGGSENSAGFKTEVAAFLRARPFGVAFLLLFGAA